MSKKIVVEVRPGLYVSDPSPNLLNRGKKPKRAKGEPPPPFNPDPLREFLRRMGGEELPENPSSDAKRKDYYTVNLEKEIRKQVYELAQKQGLTVHQLIHLWVKEKLAEVS